MTTEIITEVSYQIQNQDRHDPKRWHNSTLHTDHEKASQHLASTRERWPEYAWRLLLITTTTEVIA